MMSTPFSRTLALGELFVEVIEGKHLAIKDITGSSDPYCILDLKGNAEFRTEVIQRNLNPVWKDRDFVLAVYDKSHTLTIDVYDEDLLTSDDFMGRLEIKLAEYMDETPHNVWLDLKPRAKKKDKVKGKIHLLLHFQNSPAMEADMRREYKKVEELLCLPDCLFVSALVSSTRQSDILAKAMIRIAHAYHMALPLLVQLLDIEINSTREQTTLFRVDSWQTKFTKQFMLHVGADFLVGVFKDPLAQIMAKDGTSMELDPDRLPSKGQAAANLPNLEWAVGLVFNAIVKAKNDIPYPIRELLHHLGMTVQAKFPSAKNTAIGGFVFLRFFVPAVWSPEVFGIVSQPPEEKTRRALALVAKSLQNISNNVEFGSKESYMKPMNEFCSTLFEPVRDIFDCASRVPSERNDVQDPEPVKARDLKTVHDFVSKNFASICRQYPISSSDFDVGVTSG